MKSKTGFTLIELLIVVLIIAILAAIAVPNFLEFQTRAKVSRVKSDMRSVAVAIEAYAVDNNVVPMGAKAYNFRGLGTTTSEERLQVLSTPIAYITNPILKDPFVENAGFIRTNATQGSDPNFFNIKYQSYIPKVTSGAQSAYYSAAHDAGFTWHLASFGPSRDRRDPVNGGDYEPQEVLAGEKTTATVVGPYIYDPTNGTVSFGMIARTNKGDLIGTQYTRN